MTEYPAAGHGAARRREGDGVELVHEKIRHLILSGELRAGESFSVVQLAAQCGVSRTPLREAVRMLQREGLLMGKPNRRFVVAPFSFGDLEQIYAMRLVLENTAVRVSVPRMTPEEIADLRGHLARMEHFAGHGDFVRWEIPHQAFHTGLIAHAGERFRATLSELLDHGERYRRYYMVNEPALGALAAQEHKAIFDAVAARDAKASARSLAMHLSRTACGVMEMIRPGDVPPVLDGILHDLVGAAADDLSSRRRLAADD
jgi:GntR family transcriptional regulator, rspAB operon transcriptional repressor